MHDPKLHAIEATSYHLLFDRFFSHGSRRIAVKASGMSNSASTVSETMKTPCQMMVKWLSWTEWTLNYAAHAVSDRRSKGGRHAIKMCDAGRRHPSRPSTRQPAPFFPFFLVLFKRVEDRSAPSRLRFFSAGLSVQALPSPSGAPARAQVRSFSLCPLLHSAWCEQ